MNIIEKTVSFIGTMGRYVGSGFENVSEEEQEKRLSICRPCEHYDNGNCRICGCNLDWKTKIAVASCPIFKWGQSTAVSGLPENSFSRGCGGCGSKTA